MRTLTDLQNVLFRVGALLMLAGAAMYLFAGWLANICFVAGVLLFTSMQLQMAYDGGNFVIARLRRQQLFGAAMLLLSAIAMTAQTVFHYQAVRYNEWVVCLLIGAVLELYTAFRIPKELE